MLRNKLLVHEVKQLSMSPISTHFIYNENIFSRAFRFVDFSLQIGFSFYCTVFLTIFLCH